MAERPRRCQRAESQADVHMDKQTRQRFHDGANADWFDHYCFLFAASENCAECVTYWLHAGVSLNRTTMSQKWTALDFAEYKNATECVAILKKAAVSKTAYRAGAQSAVSHAEPPPPPGLAPRGASPAPPPEPAPPPPPPGMPPSVQKQVLQRLFQCGDDAKFWSWVLNGDVGVCREKVDARRLFLRPDFANHASEVPAVFSTWGLREFVQLRQLRAATKDKASLQMVLEELDRKEIQQATDIYRAMSNTDPNSLLYRTFHSLLDGRVVGHSIVPQNRECCRLWRLALTNEVEQFQRAVKDDAVSEQLLASAWDAYISHIPACSAWPLRMYCRVKVLRSDVDVVSTTEILESVLRAEETVVQTVAKEIPSMPASIGALIDTVMSPRTI